MDQCEKPAHEVVGTRSEYPMQFSVSRRHIHLWSDRNMMRNIVVLTSIPLGPGVVPGIVMTPSKSVLNQLHSKHFSAPARRTSSIEVLSPEQTEYGCCIDSN